MKNLYKEKDRLFKQNIELRNLTFKIDDEEQLKKIRKQQDIAYKKCQFYKNFIEASNKTNKE